MDLGEYVNTLVTLTGHKSFTGDRVQQHTYRIISVSPMDLDVCLWTVGGNPESPGANPCRHGENMQNSHYIALPGMSC